jgi:hydroxymethylglutaryl-CoA lyase
MATEDLIYLLDGLAIETRVDIRKLVAASQIIAPYLDHPLPGKYVQACSKQAARVALQSSALQ